MATVIHGDFEWDDAKAQANRSKHGVSFEEAAEAIHTDPDEFVFNDLAHPDRFNSIVRSLRRPNLLFVVSTEAGTRTRLISARKADPHEQRAYEQANRR